MCIRDRWEGDRTDEQQIGASYDELEWAMNVAKYAVDIMLENKAKGLPNKMLPNYDNLNLTLERQIEVLEIYRNFNTKNKHKMLPIPVFER